ncbi:MAG: TolC family protein, partial [Bacteroidota bacterium]
MKKRLLVPLVFLFSIVLGFGQTVKEINIGFLVDSSSEETKGLFVRLQTEIKAVVGEDAKVVFTDPLVNRYDLDKAQKNYEALLNDNTDIIVAFGTINNIIITQQEIHKKPTILFGAVNKDLISIDEDKQSSGIQNFTYLIVSQSYKDDLETFKKLSDFKNVGILVEDFLPKVLPLKETLDRELEEIGASYTLIPFANISDIEANLDEIDAVYFAGGFFLTPEENKQLAKTFIQRKLPSFTSNGIDDVEQGILATNESSENIDQFFRRIALGIEAYVTGTKLADLPIYIDYEPRLTINYNTAEAIGVPIKYSLIGQTDFVGEFKNVISEKQYDLLLAIDDALKNNLSLKSNQKDVELSTQDVKTAKSSYLPSVTASGTGTYVDPDLAEISNGQSPEFSTEGSITLQQTLFSESVNANISVQRNLQKAQEEIFNGAELDLIFDTSNAYFNTLILKRNTQIQV